MNTVEPIWKGQESLTKVTKFGPFPCTILYNSWLFYPSWQATCFERPLSWVAFIEGFHCISVSFSLFPGVNPEVVSKLTGVLNPLRAKFFRGNRNIYLYFMSFLQIDMTQGVEIIPQIRQEPTYSTRSISWLLMSWRRKEPGHQQPWYWPS